ncbi:hypothetical protein V1387_01645 [Allomuricauda taeanensis]|uniref:hypothetical protein n=1 Tax=Flagellimonas taeanensis TaxID=1005926 RepID=UPI002E7C3079|nr:hypothetical protein [Allomuricauda taeanensis]MEE1961370.1 hypothetical protein [Allomuricauda taeanensis]
MENFQIIFTGVLVIATIVYVYYTYKLVQEARKTREIGLKPYLILYIDSSETSPSSQFLNIKNVGQGVALNVKFEILKDINITSEYDKSLFDRRFLNCLYPKFPPNYLMRNYIFNFANNHEEKLKDRIEIKCNYEDIFGEKFAEIFVLNFVESFGNTKITPPETYLGMVSYNIEKLDKSIQKLSKKISPKEPDSE